MNDQSRIASRGLRAACWCLALTAACLAAGCAGGKHPVPPSDTLAGAAAPAAAPAARTPQESAADLTALRHGARPT